MIAAPRFQHVSTGGLALVVHGLFVLALMVSLSWKNLPHLPVEADLWAALPEPMPLEPQEVLPEEPPPEPVAPPQLPQPTEADIALKKAEQEKKRKEEELRRQEETRKLEEARQLEEKKRAEEKQRELEKVREKEKAEKARLESEARENAERERVEKLKRELERRRVQEDMARQAQAELEAEEAQVRALQARAVERRTRIVEDFQDRIKSKVYSYLRLPPRITGNPEAVFKVILFANGEVREATLVKSSGNPAYDVEVERAILKASPLPLPNEKDAAAEFRGGINMKFRPYPNGGGTGH